MVFKMSQHVGNYFGCLTILTSLFFLLVSGCSAKTQNQITAYPFQQTSATHDQAASFYVCGNLSTPCKPITNIHSTTHYVSDVNNEVYKSPLLKEKSHVTHNPTQ